MARQDTVKLVLIVCILVVLIIAIATKASHWNLIFYQNYALNQYPEVYPGLEGCIAIDSILMFSFILAIIFNFVADLKKYTKYLVIFIVVVLVIRLILSLLFLAGDNQYCQRQINYCNNSN